jgi:hypothetical protein
MVTILRLRVLESRVYGIGFRIYGIGFRIRRFCDLGSRFEGFKL